MKRKRGILSWVLVIFMMSELIFRPVTTYADVHSNADANNAGPSTMTVVGGPKSVNTGWLVYLVDDSTDTNGVQISDTKVFYSSSARPTNCNLYWSETRFGKTFSYNSNDIVTDWSPKEPFTTNAEGNGVKIKDSLRDEAKISNLVDKYFLNYDAAQLQEFKEKQIKVVFEPFFWGQVYKGRTATGNYLCATANGWANVLKRIGQPRGSELTNRYTNNAFPNCVKLESPMFGLPIASGKLTCDEIINSGTGIMALWCDSGIPPNTIPEEDNLKVLYQTRNWSDEFDISRAIPSGEIVNNEMLADTFYGNVKVVESASPVKTYSATYTYTWTERVPRRNGGYRTVPRSTSRSVSFSVYAKYQYIDQIRLYQFDDMQVYNKAYDVTQDYNENTMAEFPVVTPSVVRYALDGDYLSDTAKYNIAELPESHYYFPASIPDRTFSVSSASAVSSKHAKETANAKASVFSNSWSRNDRIVVTSSVGETTQTYTFMSDAPVTGCIIGGSYNTCAAESDTRYGGYGVTLADVKPLRANQVNQIMIPTNTDNNDYPTGVQCIYKNMVNSVDEMNTVFHTGRYWFEDGDSIYDHIIDGAIDSTMDYDLQDYPFGDGYPIRVHTPVIAPIMVTDNYGLAQWYPDKQLIDVDQDAEFQLKLDNNYMIKWNSDLWMSEVYGDVKNYGDSGFDPSKYDKYTLMKMLQFPFDVYYDGRFFEAGMWILVNKPDSYLDDWSSGVAFSEYESNNHWTMTPIYIPSYSKEGSGEIKAKVFAYNAYGRYEDSHEDALQVEMNSSQENYVATYTITDQLSGHIYGFSVTGVDDTDMYKGVDPDEKWIDYMEYPLASVKEEKVAGTKNRHNTETYRYLKDGSTTDHVLDYNILPLRKGSNATAGTHMGDGRLWMGTGFGFNVKTIANLWDDNDYIKITPTFKIYDTDGNLKYTFLPDGTIQQDNPFVILFKDKLEGDKLKMFGGPMDNITRTVSMGSDLFDEAYYTEEDTLITDDDYRYGDWVNYTLERWNKTHNLTGTACKTEYEMMDMAYPCYDHALITLDKNLRMLSGEYEQLYKDRRMTDTDIITYHDWNTDGEEDEYYEDREVIRFRDSMQSWYGGYCMPAILYIYDGNWQQLKDKAANGGFDLYDDFLHEDDIGDIIINFDIIAYQDGTPHLQYGGFINGARVWEIEGYDRKNKYDWGDVVTYDSQHRLSDKMTGYAVMIN